MKKTLVIIDGPKGVWAQKLGALMLKNKSVQAVMFHDTHRDADDARPRLEKYFGQYLLVSDDYGFVDKFRGIDEICWQVTKKFAPGYAPYRRPNRRMRSYAGTLSCVLNNGIKSELIETYLSDVEKSISIKNSFIYKLAYRAKIITLIKKLNAKLT